jgi:hypothetical protein
MTALNKLFDPLTVFIPSSYKIPINVSKLVNKTYLSPSSPTPTVLVGTKIYSTYFLA